MPDPGSGYPLAHRIETVIETSEMKLLWAKSRKAQLEIQLVGAECALKELEEVKKADIQRNILSFRQQLENLKKVEEEIKSKK